MSSDSDCTSAQEIRSALVLQGPSTSKQNTISVQVVPQKALTKSSSKLRSLLPKNPLAQAQSLSQHAVAKSETTSHEAYQEFSTEPESDLVGSLSLSGAEIVTSLSAGNTSKETLSQTQMIVNTSGLVGAEGLESILQQLSNTARTGGAEGQHPTIVVQLAQEERQPVLVASDVSQSTADTLTHQTSLSSETPSVVPSAEVTDNVRQVTITTEKENESDIIKKTMVEAYVKMVVCRKVTVQTVDAMSGDIIDTKVKVEEDEPVVLGVDCVETTEDLIKSTKTDPSKSRSDSSDSTCTSVTTELVLPSQESKAKRTLAQTLLRDKILKSSKLFADDRQTKSPTVVNVEPEKERCASKENSGTEWAEDLNDNSEDYVPRQSQQRKNKLASKALKDGSKISKLDLQTECPTEPVVLLPKKRGRKRNWNNALGLTNNIRTCQFCNKRFSSAAKCSNHMKKGTCVSSAFCFICSKSFPSEEELESHLVTHAKEPKLGNGNIECSDCHRSYRTKTGYMKHFHLGTCQRRKEFEDSFPGEFQCELCDFSFSSQDYLQLHRYKVHENPKDRHDCPDCGKKFYSWQGFQKHRSSTRSCTDPLKCHICGKSYSNKARESFKIHMKHHKSEISGVTFNCEECGRSYMTQVALNKHKLSHTGVKPYKCNICGKEFSMRYMVKDHARMHTGERPFLCNLCGSAFSNKGHLGRHLRSHENGTLLKRGRPKKIKDPEESATTQETELKMIDITETLQGFNSQTIQVVDSQMFDGATANGTPMIIQADNNTIIIAEGWADSSATAHPISIQNAQDIVNATAGMMPSNNS